jgi:hypothetical protein
MTNYKIIDSLDDFYSQNSIEVWEKILGDGMHYHSALMNLEGIHPMEYAIMEMYPYILPESKLLDCGCGWGGPARQIIRDLNCDVTGITVSKSQSDYIKEFKVIHSDIHDLKLTENYDIALFVESYCHLHSPTKVLKHFSNHVDRILIRDYINLEGNYVKYDSFWNMTIADKSKYINDLKVSGYTVKNFDIRPHSYQPEAGYWLNRIMQLDEKDITGQVKLLYESCMRCLQSSSAEGDTGIGICTIYAEYD